jgi:hypothetical protein
LRAQVAPFALRILHDPIHGVSAGIPQRIVDNVTTIRGETNPSFGGVNPEPIPENLGAAREAMQAGRFDLAICNDGDADRLGILDARGNFVSPHKIISLLALYLVREKKMSGDIVKTFSTTRLIEKVARALGAGFHETPIGFKYVADLMLSRNVLIGGEESGGIGFGHFLPERGGILSGLAVAECVAHFGKPLHEIVDDMEEEFGRHVQGDDRRVAVRAADGRRLRLALAALNGICSTPPALMDSQNMPSAQLALPMVPQAISSPWRENWVIGWSSPTSPGHSSCATSPISFATRCVLLRCDPASATTSSPASRNAGTCTRAPQPVPMIPIRAIGGHCICRLDARKTEELQLVQSG